MRIIRLFAVLVLLAPATAAAQPPPAVITGRVTIPGSGPGAAGVLVRIEALLVGTFTDSTGRYRLVVPGGRIVDGGSVTVGASRADLRHQHRRIGIMPGAALELDFAPKAAERLEHPCDGVVFGTRTGEAPRPPIEHVKLCRVSFNVRHGGPGGSLPRR